MSEDKIETVQTSGAETPPTFTELTPYDAATLYFRRYQLKHQRVEAGGVSPNDLQQEKELLKVSRWLDTFTAKHPEGNLDEALLQIQQEEQRTDSETIRESKEPVRRELEYLVKTLNKDLGRLPIDEEKQYLLDKRQEKAVETQADSEQKEAEFIDEVLRRGIYRVHFSGMVARDDGGPAGMVGFQTFYSPLGLEREWERGLPKVLEYEIPEIMDSGLSPDLKQFMAAENIIDGVVFSAQYQRKTRTVVTEREVEKVDMWGRKTKEKITETREEFSHNEALKYPGTDEGLVRVVYQTLVREADSSSMYTDLNTRPGNMLILDMMLPVSVAVKLAGQGKENPSFIRRVVEAAVLDENLGVQSCLNRQKGYEFSNSNLSFLDSSKERLEHPALKIGKGGIPPYEDEDWRKGKMLIDINLSVPEKDVRPVVGLSDRPTQISLARSRLKALIVSP